MIGGHFAVFRGLSLRRASVRETPETPAASSGGPNGFCYLVGQLLRFPLESIALRT